VIVYAKSEEVRKELNKRLKEQASLTDDVSKAQVVVSGRLKEEDIHDGIKALIIPYVGYNQVDQDLLEEKGILLYNTQVNGVFVAERALGLCLSLMGKIHEDFQGLKKGQWSTYEHPSEWISIRGKKIGLLGYGVIGKALHQMLKAFEVEAYTIDRGKDYPGLSLVDNVDQLIDAVDILFVQVPLTDQTEGLLDKKRLMSMKDKYLINVGRGKVIEEDALYEALDKGVLKGFASDVWYQYPKKRTMTAMPSKYPITDFPNVVCTSHSSGNVKGIDSLTYDDVAKRIIRMINGDFKGNIKNRKEDK